MGDHICRFFNFFVRCCKRQFKLIALTTKKPQTGHPQEGGEVQGFAAMAQDLVVELDDQGVGGQAVHLQGHAHAAQHPLGVVARALRLGDHRLARGAAALVSPPANLPSDADDDDVDHASHHRRRALRRHAAPRSLAN